MINLHLIFSYVKHRFVAKSSGFGIHSPFVFNFINNVLENDGNFYRYNEIEEIRHQLLKNENTITVNDLGAGSKKFSTEKRKISDIAKYSLKSPKQSKFIMRVANYFNSKNIIEIGTSLGITTLYLSLLGKDTNIITIEGDKNIFKIANKNFEKLKAKNIKAICDNFDNALPEIINNINTIDFAFIDGNHTKKASLKYFELLKQKTNENTVLIFDDIYWSKEMTQAWKQIIKDKDISISLDLFYLGLVFFKKNIPKQDFILFSKKI